MIENLLLLSQILFIKTHNVEGNCMLETDFKAGQCEIDTYWKQIDLTSRLKCVFQRFEAYL